MARCLGGHGGRHRALALERAVVDSLYAAGKCETYGVSVTSDYYNYQCNFENNMEQSRKV
jgi:hypothetical protein